MMKQGKGRVSNEEGRCSPDLNTDSEFRIGISPSRPVALRSPRMKFRAVYTGRPLCPLPLSLSRSYSEVLTRRRPSSWALSSLHQLMQLNDN